MKVAIHGRSTAPENIPNILSILTFLTAEGVSLRMYVAFFRFLKENVGEIQVYDTYCNSGEISDDTDFMLSIGGDGTFLDAARFVREKEIPLVGINLGRLGFLAYISGIEAESSLRQILSKDYTIEERSMLQVTGNFLGQRESPYALNEATIQRKGSSLIEITVAIDGEPLATYWSDGLIVATPTGSTAYSMSVGGPIVSPATSNLILSPLAPHNLALRPIVIPDSSTVWCKVATREGKAVVTMDNQMFDIEEGAELLIQKSPFTIKLIKLTDSNFYKTLRNKLHWGFDPRN